MHKARCSNNTGFLGLGSAAALKAHALAVNARLVGKARAALVRDHLGDGSQEIYLMLLRPGRHTLYVILPDSKQLCPASFREHGSGLPYLFELLA